VYRLTGSPMLLGIVGFELPVIRQVVRPIYVRMGILPQVATGLQSGANLMTPPEQE
jgi:hypothetical protein